MDREARVLDDGKAVHRGRTSVSMLRWVQTRDERPEPRQICRLCQMVVAAFVMSVLAIVVSGVSVVYVRSQAMAATEISDIERSRHLAERTPRFGAEVESMNDGGWFRLWLRLTSDQAMDEVEVTLDQDAGITFTSGQEGVDPADRSHLHAKVPSKLGQRERTAWGVALRKERPRQTTLLVQAQAGRDSWSTSLVVALPSDPANSVW